MATDRVLEGVRLIPEEIRGYEFAHGFRGYDVHEVRSFLESVGSEMLSLTAEVGALRSAALAQQPQSKDLTALSTEQLAELVGVEAASVLERATADARKCRDSSVEQGKAMLAEAQNVREKVLRELASKRKKARRELAQLRAGIEQLRESYDELRSMLDTSTSVIDRAVDDARSAAANAAHGFDRSDFEDDLAVVREQVVEAVPSVPHQPTGDERTPAASADVESQTEPSDSDAPVEAAHPISGDDSADTIAADQAPDDQDGPDGPDDSSPSVDAVPTVDEMLVAREAEHRAVLRRERAGSGVAEESGDQHDDAGSTDDELPDLPDLLDDGPVPSSREAPPLFGRSDAHVDELFARIRTSREGAVARAHEVLNGRSEDRSLNPDAPPGAASPTDVRDIAELFAGLDLAKDELAGKASTLLKRVLADQLNEILDKSRRSGAVKSVADLIPEASVATYGTALADVLAEACDRGAGQNEAEVDITEVLATVSRDIGTAIRARVASYMDEPENIDQKIRATYREWRRDRADDVAADAVISAFNLGLLAVIATSDPIRWAQRDDGCVYPDCGDNALAEGVRFGEKFPTGHTIAPLGPGCRCLVVAADE